MSDTTAFPLVLAVGARLAGAKTQLRLARRLNDQGLEIVQTEDAAQAERVLLTTHPAVIVIDLDMPAGAPLFLTNLVAWRHPAARLLFIGSGAGVSDGAIFANVPNVYAVLPTGIADDDLMDVIAFHAGPPPLLGEGARTARRV